MRISGSIDSVAKRKKRDVYGNWTWEDDGETNVPKSEQTDAISLEWRDYIALALASLETFLLPIVIFVLVILGLAIALTVFH